MLKNGRQYMGTILNNTPEKLVVSIDGGIVEFPRSAVASPPYQGPQQPEDNVQGKPEAPMMAEHPIPCIAESLRNLKRFEWSDDLRQVPALVTDRGRWQFVPRVSFWAGGFAQIDFFGDPERPTAVSVSLLDPPPDAWQHKQDLLEFMLSLSSDLALDDRFDRLDVRRDSFAVGDLWFSVSSPDSQESPGRWTVLLLYERALSSSRASFGELQSISEPLKDAVLDPTRPKSWQHGSWTVDDVAWLRRSLAIGRNEDPKLEDNTHAWTALGGERVFVRSFERNDGTYARSSNDWLHEVALNDKR